VDVEVDIDNEYVEDGVELWGASVSDRSGRAGLEEGYRDFVTWDPLTPETETALFVEFWEWLTALRAQVAGAGLTFAGYCYNAGAESGQMRRLAALCGLEDKVAELVESEDWVDLLRVFDAQ